jgi:hypothetical protein
LSDGLYGQAEEVKQDLLHRAARAGVGVDEPVVFQQHRLPGQALTGFPQGAVEGAEAVERPSLITRDDLDEVLRRPPGDLVPAAPLDFEKQVLGQRGNPAPNLDDSDGLVALDVVAAAEEPYLEAEPRQDRRPGHLPGHLPQELLLLLSNQTTDLGAGWPS